MSLGLLVRDAWQTLDVDNAVENLKGLFSAKSLKKFWE